jgi:hypothetical protein
VQLCWIDLKISDVVVPTFGKYCGDICSADAERKPGRENLPWPIPAKKDSSPFIFVGFFSFGATCRARLFVFQEVNECMIMLGFQAGFFRG